MDVALVCSIFEGLPRQGPGSDESTAHALSFIPPGHRRGKVLDIGCGSGSQTLALATICPECLVTATDIHQPFLDELSARAKKAGLDARIVTRQASMDNLPFDEGAFDIIWAEGSLFIIGLLPALRYWKRLLKPGGYLVFSDCTWFTDSPSAECREFFTEICPDMLTESRTEALIRSEGYVPVGSFRLPDAGWWDQYYTPLSHRIDMLKEKYSGNPDAQSIILGLEREMDIHRKYSKEYGYSFFILQSSDPDSGENE